MLDPVQQFRWAQSKPTSKASQDADPWIASSRLKAANLSRIHASALGKAFLGEAALLAGGAKVGAELLERVGVGHGIAEFDTGLINPWIDQS